jgi:predicted DNA-binding ribbon-helix-helix protein
MDANQEKESLPKKMCSVRLENHIYEKMSLVADRLGMNVNAYLVARIGEAVNKDYQFYEIAKNQNDSMQNFFSQIIEAAKEDQKDQ